MNPMGNLARWRWTLMTCILLLGCGPALAQSISRPSKSSSHSDANSRIEALDKSLQETRTELAQTRAEIRQLRSLLEEMNKRIASSTPASSASPSRARAPVPAPKAPTLPGRPSVASAQQAGASSPPAKISEDDWEILKARVDEQAQDKVESGSRYRLKLWGLALFNAFGVSGRVDDLDLPTLALPRAPGGASGSLGASVRQSIIGLTGIGPEVLGARTSADLQMDFFGGLPNGYGGGSSGLFRIRVSRIRFDWERTSIVGGLDTPFFSPNVPTSYMSVAVPAFASAGNLWSWSPTVRVEHRFDTSITQFKIEAGFLAPSAYAPSASGFRRPTPGESSRQPVYAIRLSANGTHGDRPVSLGISGLYFPQRFPGGATLSGWGSVLDWRFPMIPHTELSGEFFAGKGLDSFGGVPVPTIQPADYNGYIQVGGPALANIMTMGGWSQLKVTVNSRNEFNAAIGTGARQADSLAQAALLAPSLEYLSPRNEMVFVNYIFRPRSDLLFSAEYRRLRTYPLSGNPAIAGQFGLAAGFLF